MLHSDPNSESKIKQLIISITEALELATTPYAQTIAAKGLKLTLTLIRKNRGYGNSVFNPPVLVPNVSPNMAIKVRMSDKITRIITLSQEIDRAIAAGSAYDQLFESLQDSFLDLAGYSVLWAVNDDIETENATLQVCPRCGQRIVKTEPHTPSDLGEGMCEVLEDPNPDDSDGQIEIPPGRDPLKGYK